jgi:hypothetical protein
MSTSEDRWFEVWFSPGEDLRPTWLLVVTPDTANPGRVLVFDPQENYKTVYQGHDYEEARLWLNEDEYELVDRVFPDDGWPLGTKSSSS